jgi:hypothetical protein
MEIFGNEISRVIQLNVKEARNQGKEEKAKKKTFFFFSPLLALDKQKFLKGSTSICFDEL